MDWLLVSAMTLALAVPTLAPERQPPDWCVGHVIEQRGQRMLVHREVCSRTAAASRIEVDYRGELPAGVCVGADVYITGSAGGDRFDAARIVAFNNGRYDRCWRWRCTPVQLWPAECRSPFR